LSGLPPELEAKVCLLVMAGRLWIESDTGRLLKTEMIVSGNDRVTTTFQYDERFQIAVPIESRESFGSGRTAFEGRATYGRFRQFGVTPRGHRIDHKQRRAVLLDRRQRVPHLLLPRGPRAVAACVYQPPNKMLAMLSVGLKPSPSV
jgi:hypothetical protein